MTASLNSTSASQPRVHEQFYFKGFAQVRYITVNGRILWVAADLANAAGKATGLGALFARLDERYSDEGYLVRDHARKDIPGLGGRGAVVLITVPGVPVLLSRIKTAGAAEVRAWLADVVWPALSLPSFRQEPEPAPVFDEMAEVAEVRGMTDVKELQRRLVQTIRQRNRLSARLTWVSVAQFAALNGFYFTVGESQKLATRASTLATEAGIALRRDREGTSSSQGRRGDRGPVLYPRELLRRAVRDIDLVTDHDVDLI